jgi:hypothetical protein
MIAQCILHQADDGTSEFKPTFRHIQQFITVYRGVYLRLEAWKLHDINGSR